MRDTDADLLALARFARNRLGVRGDGSGRCFTVCQLLVAILRSAGLKVRFVKGLVVEIDVEHYWVALEDGRVLDPTAAQFNDEMGYRLPPIYLGEPSRIHNHPVKDVLDF